MAGEQTGDSHISESRWINIPRDVGVGGGVGLTREVGEGRCRLRSALILAHSSAAQPLPITSSHNYSVCVRAGWGGGERRALLSGELKAQQEVPAHVL